MIRTGIDLVEISRIEKSIKNPRFLTRVFSACELELFAGKINQVQSIAANFAAKEAFSKAVGTGINGFSLDDISVLRNERGAPYLVLRGMALTLAGEAQISVSLTHTKNYAAAIVVLEDTQ